MNKVEFLEKEIEKLKKRNKKVELEKSWETSLYRKISIIIITYFFMILIIYLLKIENIFISAIIPTLWYFFSTLSILVVKNIYIKKLK